MLDWGERVRLANMTHARNLAVIAAKRAEHFAKIQAEEKKRNDALKLKLAIPWHLQSVNKNNESNLYRNKLISYINKNYNKSNTNCYKQSINTSQKEHRLYIWQALKKTVSFVICFIWFIGFININKNLSLLEYMLGLFSVYMVMFFVNYND